MRTIGLWSASALLCLAGCQSVVVDVAPPEVRREASVPAEASVAADASVVADAAVAARDAAPETRPPCVEEKTALENGLVCWTCIDEAQQVLLKQCRALAPKEPPPGPPLNCGPGEDGRRVCKVCRDQHGTVVYLSCQSPP